MESVSGVTVGGWCTIGFGAANAHAAGCATHTTCIPPLLSDENSYSRISKIVHGQSYTRWNLGILLGRPPALYAIWHHYKNTVTRCYAVFFQLMMYIGHGKSPEGHEIPTKRKLINKEISFACLLVVAHKVRDMLNLHLMAISRQGWPYCVATKLQLSQLTVLPHLQYEYAPALFLVRTRVRDCYRGGGTRQLRAMF